MIRANYYKNNVTWHLDRHFEAVEERLLFQVSLSRWLEESET